MNKLFLLLLFITSLPAAEAELELENVRKRNADQANIRNDGEPARKNSVLTEFLRTNLFLLEKELWA